MRSLAGLTGQTLAAGAAPDSEDVLPALLGRSRTGRKEIVLQGGALSLHEGQWKYIAPGAGAKMNVQTNTELGNDREAQDGGAPRRGYSLGSFLRASSSSVRALACFSSRA